MPSRKAVVITAGAAFVDIPVSGAYHRMTLQMSDPTLQIDYKSAIDSFATTSSSSSALGHKVEILGHGRDGIIARPINYNAIGTPVASENGAKVRTTAGAGGTLIVEEFEF